MASLTYTPVGGSETVHVLATPIRIAPGRFSLTKRRRLWVDYSSDYSEREVFSLDTSVEEFTGEIRYDDQPNELRDMLEEALYNGVTLTYSPDGSATYPLQLIATSPGGQDEVVISPDRDRGGFGEWEVGVTLRRVDGSSLDALVANA